jgi:hypothetical protein
MPSNRKFERGKLAKKSAEQIAAQREAEYEHYMASEEGKEAEAVLAEYRKKRGPTLMQKHHEEVAAKRAKSGTTGLSEMRKKGFDRDRVSVCVCVCVCAVIIHFSSLCCGHHVMCVCVCVHICVCVCVHVSVCVCVSVCLCVVLLASHNIIIYIYNILCMCAGHVVTPADGLRPGQEAH